jgi:antitoxin protein of toxin-antitoxin system
MPLLRKLATIATAAEAARRYAKKNPDKAAQYLDQAASFVDKQTKGKYTAQIDGVAQKVKGVAGVRATPGAGSAANGYPKGPAGRGTQPASPSATSPVTEPVTRPTPGPAV